MSSGLSEGSHRKLQLKLKYRLDWIDVISRKGIAFIIVSRLSLHSKGKMSPTGHSPVIDKNSSPPVLFAHQHLSRGKQFFFFFSC